MDAMKKQEKMNVSDKCFSLVFKSADADSLILPSGRSRERNLTGNSRQFQTQT